VGDAVSVDEGDIRQSRQPPERPDHGRPFTITQKARNIGNSQGSNHPDIGDDLQVRESHDRDRNPDPAAVKIIAAVGSSDGPYDLPAGVEIQAPGQSGLNGRGFFQVEHLDVEPISRAMRNIRRF
jgi:hypothetical protein